MRRWPWAAAAGAAAAAAFARPFRVEVAGESMMPTLRPGDWLLATRGGRIGPGSVVVLRHPGRALDLVKRVRAVPGDEVEGRILGADEYLVVGDNESASTDGRRFGPIPREAIEGVVRFRYRPDPGPVRASLRPGR
ncbi:MAG TPA: S26 family signal peptidase [Actinomycetota bacterium]|nr:S26 family signal peptidase [Actinomycetota bacterium]